MDTAFILCSRLASSRIPGKVFRSINGEPLIHHLIKRLQKTKIPVILAVPPEDFADYRYLDRQFDNLYIYVGASSDPLERMANAAIEYKIKNIIRVTHDKIFVDDFLVNSFLTQFKDGCYDYLYSSQFTDGSAFEIISQKALLSAREKYSDVEFISYAVRSITDNVLDAHVPIKLRSKARFLVDYPEDLDLLETVLCGVGNDCRLINAIEFCSRFPWVNQINKMPDVTVYTCAYNEQDRIGGALNSIRSQMNFKYIQQIIVDDHSSDMTPHLSARYSQNKHNVKWIRNQKNLGLASSSNVALKAAKGKYVIRLDADDTFYNEKAVSDLFNAIEATGFDAVYPNFIQQGKEISGDVSHHPGGAIFSTKALNHLKFTDQLRHYDGLDLFRRASEQLNIGYLNKPIFNYTQRPDSMSKTNLAERERVRKSLDNNLKVVGICPTT